MIQLQGITKSFGSLQVLRGIDLNIDKARSLVLLVRVERERLLYFKLWELWMPLIAER